MDPMSSLLQDAVSDYETKQAEAAFPEKYPLVYTFESHQHLVFFERQLCRFFPSPLHEIDSRSLVCYFDSLAQAGEAKAVIESIVNTFNAKLIPKPVAEGWLTEYLSAYNLGCILPWMLREQPLKTKRDHDEFKARIKRDSARRNDLSKAYHALNQASPNTLVMDFFDTLPNPLLQAMHKDIFDELRDSLTALASRLANHAEVGNLTYPYKTSFAVEALLYKSKALFGLSEEEKNSAWSLEYTHEVRTGTPRSGHARKIDRTLDLSAEDLPEIESIKKCMMMGFEGHEVSPDFSCESTYFGLAKRLLSPRFLNMGVDLQASTADAFIARFVFAVAIKHAASNTQSILDKVHNFADTLGPDSDVPAFFQELFPQPDD